MRKVIESLIIISALFVLTACDKISDVEPPYYRYIIEISFTDSSGKDLVAPLGEERWRMTNLDSDWHGTINPDKYTIEVEYSNPPIPFSCDGLVRSDHQGPVLFMREIDGKYYLSVSKLLASQDFKQDSLVIKLACPTIFGDSTTHKLDTFWSYDSTVPYSPELPWSFEQFPQCIRASFDGEGLVPRHGIDHVPHYGYFNYFIDIVIDR